MENLVRVLVVDDEANQRTALARLIAAWRYEVQTASDGSEALAVLKKISMPDILITDLNMPGMDSAKACLHELRKLPSPPVTVVVTACGNLETRARDQLHHLGAFCWYIEKPIQAAALKMILERAAEKKSLMHHAGLLERELASRGAVGGLIGESAAMQEIFSLVQQVAPTSATVLITGESGTGKEVLARAVHQLSPRRGGPFFAVNCAAMPEALMESELFGHEKGAFTGAVERRAGCFELAKGGTILLDEIGDMPMATQAKLLRVLEDREGPWRLGSAHETDLDVRVLASTNRDLQPAIIKQTFREDLYFRLNVFEIMLPALRKRKADIPLLAADLLRSLNQKHDSRITDLAPEVLAILSAYDWPGNVRELRNVLERAAILCGSGTITRAHLPPSFGGGTNRGGCRRRHELVLFRWGSHSAECYGCSFSPIPR